MSHPLPDRESLTVEFKSDRGPLPDRDLIAAVVCLANTDGGDLYLGVEDDGAVTGLDPKRSDVSQITAFIANRTVPPVSVRARLVQVDGQRVAHLEIPKSERLVATSEGLLQRRRLKHDGRPECVPFLPHEFATRESSLQRLDYVALPVAGATLDDLDPAERARLRGMIERFQGDHALLGLDDPSLDGALGLTKREGDLLRPTVLGLLLIGREAALRDHLPTHEVAFQVLDGEQVVVNDFSRRPLLHGIEWLTQRFEARVEEHEIQVGLFRVPVPNVDRRAFREAVANALTHRDYTRLGAVHVQWKRDGLTVSNPGGFVERVTLDNLLTTEPRPRNPMLADAFKRIGLVERTGRGVDLMYRGLLRYGRPAPDYASSSSTLVVVRLSTDSADRGFLELVLDAEQRRGGPLPIDGLIILSLLRDERRVDRARIQRAIQRDEASARRAVEALVEAGFVEPHGVRKGRTYTLSADLYRRLGQPVAYVRQAGFDAIQHEAMVMRHVEAHGVVRRQDVMALCRLTGTQASRLLSHLAQEGKLAREGAGRSTQYRRGQKR
jgi:ATP-dependent DNA helicase RecG